MTKVLLWSPRATDVGDRQGMAPPGDQETDVATTRAQVIRPSRHGDATARGVARRLPALLAASALALGLLIGAPVAGVPAETAQAALTSGFVDETLVNGLDSPTAIVFAPGGRVFVSEKRGVVKTWATVDSLEQNDAPGQTIDLRTDVMNFWDRGLLGLAVDPGYPGNPYLYVLYTYNAIPGGAAPRWPSSGDGNSDPCPNPPGATSDGCVVQNRLERITVNTTTGVSTGRTTLLTGWCQQFPSHSAGSVVFGPDGMLYVSGGDGANFNGGTQDYGQYGGTKPDTSNPITPRNPCGDEPGSVGSTLTAPTAEGGALRSQSFRRPASESAVLGGTVLRLNPATGAAAAGNPAIGDPDPIRKRIVAYGLRNPFRMTFRPGTSDLYVGDVGSFSWEEVNRIPNPTASVSNFGWPCHEGPLTGSYYTSVTLNLCSTLSEGNAVRPLFDYPQTGHMASGDACPPVSPATSAGASVSGLAFYTGSDYPAQYQGALFVADYARNCIVVLPDRGDGVPQSTAIPFSSTVENPVMLTKNPDGDLVYVAFTSGEIHRFRYQPPVASFTATPSAGTAPLLVSFNGSASTAPAGVASYDWDFGDGSAHGSGVTAQHTYPAGTWTASLTITDSNGATATTTRMVSASNSAPVVTIDQPTCTTDCWKVNDVISMVAHATDPEDGTMPASAFEWHVALWHCHTPSDCHEHELIDVFDVRSTSIVAPDHDAGSFLRVTVKVTDSGNRSTTKSIDVAPRESTLRVVSNPAGLPVTLDGETANGSVGPLPAIVGHVATISAASTVTAGEDRWTFSSWSDGGARTHTVTAGESPRTFTANYTKTASDASNTCAGAPIITPASTWFNASFGAANDVDWVRFQVTKSGFYRFLLGKLPVNGVATLYSGCTTVLATSDQAGTHWEEIVRSLAPGTYAIRMSSVGGVSSGTSHQWMIQPLSGGAALLSALPAMAPAGSVRLAGEIMNTSSTTRAVTVTARLYSSSGSLLKTVSTRTQLAGVPKYGRALFTIQTTKPAGYASVKYTVTSVGASTATRLLGATGVATSAPGAGQWKVTGSILNSGSTTATHVSFLVGIFDNLGRVLNATSGSPSATTLAPGASATFTTTFSGLTTTPNGTTARGKAAS